EAAPAAGCLPAEHSGGRCNRTGATRAIPSQTAGHVWPAAGSRTARFLSIPGGYSHSAVLWPCAGQETVRADTTGDGRSKPAGNAAGAECGLPGHAGAIPEMAQLLDLLPQ